MLNISNFKYLYKYWLKFHSKEFAFYALPIYTSQDTTVESYIDKFSHQVDRESANSLCIFSLSHGRDIENDLEWVKNQTERMEDHYSFGEHRHQLDRNQFNGVFKGSKPGRLHSIPFEDIVMEEFMKEFDVELTELPCIVVFTNLASQDALKINLDGSEDDVKKKFRWLAVAGKHLRGTKNPLEELEKKYTEDFGTNAKIDKIHLFISVSDFIANISSKIDRLMGFL
jgi:hypothetical protein